MTVELRRPLTVEQGTFEFESGEPNQTYAHGRVCSHPDCSTRLSIYNEFQACSVHQEGLPDGLMLVPGVQGGLVVAREPGSPDDDLPVGFTGGEALTIREAANVLGYSVSGVRSRVETRGVAPAGWKREGTRGGRSRTYTLRHVIDAFAKPAPNAKPRPRRKVGPRQVVALADPLVDRGDSVTLAQAAPLFGYVSSASLSRRLIWYPAIAPAPVGEVVGAGGPARLYRLGDLALFLIDSFDAPAPKAA